MAHPMTRADLSAAERAALAAIRAAGLAGVGRADLCAAARVADSAKAVHRLLRRLRDGGHPVVGVKVGRVSRCDVYRFMLRPEAAPAGYRPMAPGLGITPVLRAGVSLARVPSVDGRA